MKKQVLAVHGGDTFATYEDYWKFLENFEIDLNRYRGGFVDWKATLGEVLGEEYEVYTPRFPNPTNAQYSEWKLWMDKIISHLRDDVIIIGHSLGASFVAKYLTESNLSIRVGAVLLVSGVAKVDTDGNGLHSFALPAVLDLQTEKVFLYHSKDDPVVAYDEILTFAKLLPHAQLRTLDDRGHLNQEQFPELVTDIQSVKL